MASHRPKRISELASVDSDIETPEKSSKNSHYSKSYGMFPKRIADFDIQEYDSDDDRNDKLNCAILNDSFVLSPTKELDIPSTPAPSKDSAKKSKVQEENNKNVMNQNIKSADDSGFISRISTLKVRSPEVIKLNPVVVEENSKANRRKSRTQLFPTEPPPLSTPKVFQSSTKNANSKIEEQKKEEEPVRIQVPAPRLPLTSKKDVESSSHETPYKKTDQQIFVTPSARPLQAAKNSSSVSTCERDLNKRPKILFTTPVARPFPGSNLATPIDSRQTSQRKLSPIKEPSEEKEKPSENILIVNQIEYEIDKKIGSGGSSSVYLAKGRKSGKECAIKLVDLDGDPSVVEGYLNETKLLAKLQGNINVVALYDYCHIPEKNILYMVMEKGDSDLHKILQRYTTHIPLYALTNYWYQMLQAVNYIHQNGVIHSDLKPANFLMINGRLKLIDFGIASNIAIDSTSIIKFSQAGTFNYISPEALIDTSSGDSPSTHHQPRIRLSTKSDVWSLGCILYLLLYKKTPFSHIKVIHQKMMTLTNPKTVIEYPELPNFYPPIFTEMLKKCLVYNPKERSSVADLLKYPFDMIISVD
ncbi:dual specificity protein kinase TTK [Chironomus tepperi]|uniref:dual specificity protein kinase TTK n=1 Tax=Chironomus tepperi TaxID=113505 RepID=UPI00391F3FEE